MSWLDRGWEGIKNGIWRLGDAFGLEKDSVIFTTIGTYWARKDGTVC